MQNHQNRYLKDQIKSDLTQKMVFVGGPRQVGKTTLCKSFIKSKSAYLNWDFQPHKELILKNELPAEPLILLDEIHKYKKWRGWLKGNYDVYKETMNFIVTGSARLDLYRHGGDSLQGRYHYLRLHPLSVAELKIKTQSDFETLLKLGGFPEPFFRSSEIQAKRWSQEYRTRFIQDDLRSLEQFVDLDTLELLIQRLPQLVGSPLSINSLREDLQKSQQTLAKWITALEKLYGIFRIPPYGPPKVKAIKKEQKHYHFDWTLIEDEGVRFENLVACHLLKWVHFEQDSKARPLELRYFRDVNRREVDFVVLEGKLPILFIECKLSDYSPSDSLRYIKERAPKNAKTKSIQLVGRGSKHFVKDGVEVMPAVKFLETLV